MHRPLLALLSFVPLCAPSPTDGGGSAGFTTSSAPCDATPLTDAIDCASQCGADADCASGNYCLPGGCRDARRCGGGRCVASGVMGDPCDRAAMCATGCCTEGTPSFHPREQVCMPASYCPAGSDAGTINLRDAGGG